MIVLDASVVIKWFIPETDSDKAAQFIENYTLNAPHILDMEVKGGLLRAYRQRRQTHAQAEMALTLWRDGHGQSFQFASQLALEEQAIYLSLQIKHTFYDCFYLALAQSHDIPLITADAVFHDRARQAYDNVHMLNAYNAA